MGKFAIYTENSKVVIRPVVTISDKRPTYLKTLATRMFPADGYLTASVVDTSNVKIVGEDGEVIVKSLPIASLVQKDGSTAINSSAANVVASLNGVSYFGFSTDFGASITTSNANITLLQNVVKTDSTDRGVFVTDAKDETSSKVKVTTSTAILQAGANTKLTADESSPGTLTFQVAAGNAGSEVATTGLVLTGQANGRVVTDLTGEFNIKGGSSTGAGQMAFLEASSNGTSVTTFRGAASLAGDITFTLPATVGQNTQTLITDGNGNLGWSNPVTSVATLTTPRAINGVDFDGSAAITVTAAGSTLSDTVPVTKGGTGATTLTDNALLIGNGTDEIESSAYVAHGQGYLNFKGSSASTSGAIRFYEAADNGAASLIVNTPTDYGNANHVLTLPLETGTVALTTSSTTFTKTSDTHFSYQGDVVKFGTGSTTQGELCYYTSLGTWLPTSAGDVAKSGGVLLAMALGADPDVDGMLLRGMVTLDHDPGTIADELYISTASGNITSDVSGYGTDDVVRVVGYCLDSTDGQIWFNPSNDFIVLA